LCLAAPVHAAGDSESWAYPHRCAGAWTRIRPTIVNDTQAAFAAWAVEKGFQLPTFQPGDVVIQSRCSKDTLLQHPEHGPAAFSFYSSISPAARSISVVADLVGRDPLCARIHDAQLAWLRRKAPAANVSLVGGGIHQAFSRLLLAPVLYKDAQSSFGLWAALANRGEVWSLPLLSAYTNNTQPALGKGWHWSEAPVLYPHVAAAAGITLQRPDAIIEWLETH
jgi:hypothetical protein